MNCTFGFLLKNHCCVKHFAVNNLQRFIITLNAVTQLCVRFSDTMNSFITEDYPKAVCVCVRLHSTLKWQSILTQNFSS